MSQFERRRGGRAPSCLVILPRLIMAFGARRRRGEIVRFDAQPRRPLRADASRRTRLLFRLDGAFARCRTAPIGDAAAAAALAPVVVEARASVSFFLKASLRVFLQAAFRALRASPTLSGGAAAPVLLRTGKTRSRGGKKNRISQARLGRTATRQFPFARNF